MRYLILGGAGFIGSNLARKLSEDENNYVIIYDNLYRGKIENIKDIYHKDNVFFVNGDIRDKEFLAVWFGGGVDVVFHLAAQSNVLGSISDKSYCFTTNVIGTHNVLELAKEYEIEKVIFTSSREVYGNSILFPVSEKTLLNPKNYYGASKVCGEQYCKIFSELENMNVGIVRLANVFGKGDTNRVVPSWIEKIKNDEILEIYGGGQVLDFVHIDTVVDALVKLSEKDFRYEVINIGSGKGISILELKKMFEKILGKKMNANILPSRNFEVNGYIANIEKMKDYLGIIPENDFEEKLRELIYEN